MAKKEEKIYVVGHKNPDTDSICSAIAYANLKREITGNDYVAKRAGQINEETHYVLQKFGVKVPTLLENVKLQVKDMDIHQIDGIGPNVSMKDTWIKMKENNIKTIPILRDEELLGVISTGDIATSYMEVYDNMILSKAKTQYRNIKNTLDGEMVTGNEHGYFTKGKAAIGASSPDQPLHLHAALGLGRGRLGWRRLRKPLGPGDEIAGALHGDLQLLALAEIAGEGAAGLADGLDHDGDERRADH